MPHSELSLPGCHYSFSKLEDPVQCPACLEESKLHSLVTGLDWLPSARPNLITAHVNQVPTIAELPCQPPAPLRGLSRGGQQLKCVTRASQGRFRTSPVVSTLYFYFLEMPYRFQVIIKGFVQYYLLF